jgi:hypothetical protein
MVQWKRRDMMSVISWRWQVSCGIVKTNDKLLNVSVPNLTFPSVCRMNDRGIERSRRSFADIIKPCDEECSWHKSEPTWWLASRLVGITASS